MCVGGCEFVPVCPVLLFRYSNYLNESEADKQSTYVFTHGDVQASLQSTGKLYFLKR